MGFLAKWLAGIYLLVLMVGPGYGQSLAPKKLRKAAATIPVTSVPVPRGDPVAGKIKSFDDRCQECHAHDGNAIEIGDGVSGIGKFPKLAGQRYDYIIKQFTDFRDGRRSSDEMYVMASTVDEYELRDIAAYFSSLPVMQGDGGKGSERARQLFVEGDPVKGIPACSSCHIERNVGGAPQGTVAPIISGQHRRYLHKQLSDWRSSERRNSPGGVMSAIGGRLSDKEIEALAEYLSGL